MRLEPIEKPRGLVLRIAYWMSRRSLGAVASSIVEITWLNALGSFFNLMAVPLQLESDDLLSLALERSA